MEYTNSQIKFLIEEYVHNSQDREMLYSRLVDGLTFEQIGFNFGMTTKTVRKRLRKQEDIIFRHLPG